jgi:hypothetical protein
MCMNMWAGDGSDVSEHRFGRDGALAVRHGAVPANPTRELERLSVHPRRVPRVDGT